MECLPFDEWEGSTCEQTLSHAHEEQECQTYNFR